MKILQIYPCNNPVSNTSIKPIISAGLPYIEFSKYKQDIGIISSFTKDPYNENVVVMQAKKKKDYHKEVESYILTLKELPKIIEIHQDNVLAAKLSKKLKGRVNVCLIKHVKNLYHSLKEKFWIFRKIYAWRLLRHITYVYGVSDFITHSFKKEYPSYGHKFKTLYNNYGYLLLKNANLEVDFASKENAIMFVGKPLRVKGIFPFMRALGKVLPKADTWKAIIISAFFSTKKKYREDLENLLQEPAIKGLQENKQIILHQNFTSKEVLEAMQKAKILVVPSIYIEVFGLVALEGHLAGCILISSGTGGLPEVSDKYAYYLNKVSTAEIVEKLTYVINNIDEATNMAKKARDYVLNKFEPKKLANEFDKVRSQLLKE